MASLLSLPNEILVLIADMVHPGTIVAFASTCSEVHNCSEKALKTHERNAARLAHLHDRHPLNMLNCFREFAETPDLAWYVQSLEFFELRISYSGWTSTDYSELYSDIDMDTIEEAVDYSHYGDVDAEPVYQEEEIELVASVLSNSLYLTKDEVDLWVSRLRRGSEEPLKAVLLVWCSMLSRVVFYGYDTGYGAGPNPFGLLTSSIRRTFDSGLKLELLSNIKEVWVDQPAPFRHPHDNMFLSAGDTDAFLLLPTIQKFAHEHISLEDYERKWQAGLSTCSDLVLGCYEIEYEYAADLVLGCKSLNRYVGDSYPETVQALLAVGQGTLETLITWDNRMADPDSNLGLEMYLANSNNPPQGFSRLRLLTLNIKHLFDPRESEDEPQSSPCLPLGQVLGPSVRTIQHIRIENATGWRREATSDVLSVLIEFLDAEYPMNLRTICLDFRFFPGWPAEDAMERDKGLEPPNLDREKQAEHEALLERLRTKCAERSIFLHTGPPPETNCGICSLPYPHHTESRTLPELPVPGSL